MIQTGPKSQWGGLKKGLFNVTYQVETDETVKKDPMMPANWQMTIEGMNLKKLLFDIFTLAGFRMI